MAIQYNLGGRAARPAAAQHAAMLDQATRLHQQGQLAQANQIYNTILQANPNHGGALHMLGVLAYQTGHHDAACELIGKAIEQNPKDPAPQVNRGLALSAAGRHEESLAHFDRAIALRPEFAEAHVNRGKALAELKRYEEALASYEKAIKFRPAMAAAHNNKGNTEHQLGRLDDALASFEHAASLDPRYVEAFLNLAKLHAESDRRDDALRCFERVLELQPKNAEAQNGLGALAMLRDEHETALQYFQAAVQYNAQFFAAWRNYGRALHAEARYAESVVALKEAVKLKPEDADSRALLAIFLVDAGFYSEAENAYREAIDLAPDLAGLRFNFAILQSRFGRYEDALTLYREAHALDPRMNFLIGGVVDCQLKINNWNSLSSDLEECRQSIIEGRRGVRPFVALSMFDDPRVQLLSASVFVENSHPEANVLDGFASKKSAEKIKIGYYSADFHSHATAYLVAQLFEEHYRERFELVAFSFGPDVSDAMRRRLKGGFDQFVDVREKTDIDVARVSRELGIDIAVDLKGFTQDGRFGIFAHRCAPIQVSYLGYPGTTGAPYMDYVVVDKVVVPPEAQQHFTEKVVYLPHSYQVNDATRKISDRVFTKAELGLPEQGFVFCCFNNNYKIMPSVFDIWMRLLQAVPGSVLWLLKDNESVVENLRREAQARGVEGDRLVFAPRMPLDEHLARHKLADLFLDTLPVNAHTTASDALWAGLPVLTRAGKSFAARVAASLLHAVGLPELVTETVEDYEALALALARDPQRLHSLRDKLNEQKGNSPLFDAKRFARDIEAAYVAMHERHLKGLPPDVIEVADLRGD